MHLHNKIFIDQFYNRVVCEQLEGLFETITWLVFGPREDVKKYEGYTKDRLMLNCYTKDGYMKYGILNTLASPLVFSNASGQIAIDDT